MRSTMMKTRKKCKWNGLCLKKIMKQEEGPQKKACRYFDLEKLRDVNKWYTFRKGGPTGQGTYSKVRLACGAAGERVAIKCFERKEGQKNAYHDVQMLQRLKDHPNIVQVIEMMTNETRTDLFMIMEEARCDLSKLIFRKDVSWWMSEGQIKGYALQMFRALAFCHQNQVMHLDVKPENVLIMANNVVKLTDFGLSCVKIPGHLYSSNVVTQWYRAPEILLHSHDYDYAVDVWAAACVLVEMLSGKHFLAGATGNEASQCLVTWEMCGSPLLSQWPEWAHHRIAKTVTKAHERVLLKWLSEQRTGRFKPHALSLIDDMLRIVPSERLTVAQVLEHEYFGALERPLKPEQMIFPEQLLFAHQKKPEPKKQQHYYAHNMQPKGKQRVTK